MNPQRTRMGNSGAALAGTCGLSLLVQPLALSQTLSGGWEISVSNVVSPTNPSATIEVRAFFDPVPGVADLFAAGDFDLVAAEGQFSLPHLHLTGPNQSVGTLIGPAVMDAAVHQLHFPPSILGKTSNPILVWSATWTTGDFAPRLVPVTTLDTNLFAVYALQTGTSSSVPLANITHGQAVIQVIPAPASVVLLLPLMGRRRR